MTEEKKSLIEKACKMVGWTEKEFYVESERSGYSPNDFAMHLIKEKRMSKMFERGKKWNLKKIGYMILLL